MCSLQCAASSDQFNVCSVTVCSVQCTVSVCSVQCQCVVCSVQFAIQNPLVRLEASFLVSTVVWFSVFHSCGISIFVPFRDCGHGRNQSIHDMVPFGNTLYTRF